MEKTKIEPITDGQIKEIEGAILWFHLRRKISAFTAKSLIFLLRKSKNLTKGVALKFNPDIDLEKGKKVAHAAHDFCESSSAGDNRVNSLIREMGSPFSFYGYHGDGGLGASLAPKLFCQKEEEQISFTIGEIQRLQP